MPRIKLAQNVKTYLLAGAIFLGAVANGHQSHAEDIQTTILAGGCFWCVESDFESVDGVIEAVSGFAGGHVENPTYRQVVRGSTGHLEVVELTYDADIVSYAELTHLFLRSVDVVDAGGQFCDRGHSYTTGIFVQNDEERAIAAAAIAEAETELGQMVVTPILDAAPFYAAEDYHQNYYRSDELIVTRFGPRRKSVAYGLYRNGCGRDQRIAQLWGEDAPFLGDH